MAFLPLPEPDLRLQPNAGRGVNPVRNLTQQRPDLRCRSPAQIHRKSGVLFRNGRVAHPESLQPRLIDQRRRVASHRPLEGRTGRRATFWNGPRPVAGDNSHYTTDSDEKQPERGVNSFVISGKMMDKPRGKGYNIA